MNDIRQLILRNSEGGYIFVSHDHDDIKKVRIIRNVLEKNGYEPLCFYLRCLTDDDEVEGLIKREIDSRDIFLYVESENSKNSTWVNKERNYINKCNKTTYTINIDDADKIEDQINEILDKTRVFVSFAHADRRLYKQLKDALIKEDLKVCDAMVFSVEEKESVLDRLKNMIALSVRFGCYVCLITENALKSKEIVKEIEYALKQKSGLIIPVVVSWNLLDPRKLPLKLLSLCTHQGLIISEDPSKEELDKIVQTIKYALKHKDSI